MLLRSGKVCSGGSRVVGFEPLRTKASCARISPLGRSESEAAARKIKITQMNQPAGGRGRGGWGGTAAAFEDDEGDAHEQAMEELRGRLQMKIMRLRERMIREEGYVLDEVTDSIIPPGWIRDPSYVPPAGRS